RACGPRASSRPWRGGDPHRRDRDIQRKSVSMTRSWPFRAAAPGPFRAGQRAGDGRHPTAGKWLRGSGPAPEKVKEKIDRVGEDKVPIPVRIKGRQASRLDTAQEKVGEDSNGIRDVDPAVPVGIAAAEPNRIESSIPEDRKMVVDLPRDRQIQVPVSVE